VVYVAVGALKGKECCIGGTQLLKSQELLPYNILNYKNIVKSLLNTAVFTKEKN